jgi:hypothetical protein
VLSATATVDLSEFYRLRDQTKRAAAGLCMRAARDAAKAGRDRAKERAPVGTYYNLDGSSYRGGRLKREITVRFDRAVPFGAEWEFSSPTPYARYVEEGTRPHPISVDTAFQLVFYWPVIGGVFEGFSVNHPGTQPQPFMAPGSLEAQKTLIQTVERGWVSIAARWN